MLSNYFKIAIRSFWKQRFYSLINVLGLATGLTAALFILLYVKDELSYDRFHEKGARMYRITETFQEGDSYTTTAMTPYKIAALLAEYSSAVESFTRLDANMERHIVEVGSGEAGKRKYEEEAITYADSTFFQNFSIDLLRGDPATVLMEPYAVVISADKAETWFGGEDPVGKTISITRGYSGRQYEARITGVMAPMPANMHFHFDVLVSMATMDILLPGRMDNWGWTSVYSYLVLKDQQAAPRLEAMFKEVTKQHAPEWFQEWTSFGLQPMLDIHLHSEIKDELQANGSMANVYVFSIVGIFILLIAGINYMNLATARAANRAKEVGLRKVVGARQRQLVYQFLCESLLITGLAFALAVLAVQLLLPYFNTFTEKDLHLQNLAQPLILAACGVGTLALGLFAGSYPALLLSSFKPMKVLKGMFAKTGTQTLLLRKGLVVFQFTISIVLIIGILVIYQQWKYLRTKDLGIQTEQMLILPIRSQRVEDAYPTFKQELLKNPQVLSVTATSKTPLDQFPNYTVAKMPNQEEYTLPSVAVREDFFETYGAPLAQGRAFRSYQLDSSAIILNEAAVKLLGIEDPLGMVIPFTHGFSPTVVGVVKDFNFESLYSAIRPMYFVMTTTDIRHITVRVRPDDIPGVLRELQRTWDRFGFEDELKFSFLDRDIHQSYAAEALFLKIFTVFASLAILIACMGILGLASYTALQRHREIGIRKVLGASVAGIVALLSRDFIGLVLLAALVAFPIAWYFMNAWLEDFAYRIEISWWVFALAGVIALLIALASISFQSIRAALAHPVEALKQE